MNIDDYKPYPASRFGGQVDYQGPTSVVNGSALLARMVRFLPDQVETCFGTVDTMRRIQDYEEVTGINVLEVLGVLNPRQVPLVFGDQGTLVEENPAGSGSLIELQPPFPLPAGSYMRCADAENTTTMAFSDGRKGKCPVLRYNGLLDQLTSPQNPIGGLWNPNLVYIAGDLHRSPDGRWWRCTKGANGQGSTTGLQYPQSNGHFGGGVQGTPPTPGKWIPVTAADAVGGSQWEEWTPACPQYLPAPDLITLAPSLIEVPNGGTIGAGNDVYVKFTYYLPGVGESPRSIAASFINTTQNADAVLVQFSDDATGGPLMPRWMADIILQPARFLPFYLNVYIVIVATGSPAPVDSDYGLFALMASVGAPVTVNSNIRTRGQGLSSVTLTAGLNRLVDQVPQCVVQGGGGSGGTVHLLYSVTFLHSDQILYKIHGIVIDKPGSYNTVPNIVFVGDDAAGFTATCTIGGGGGSGTANSFGSAAIAQALVSPSAPGLFIGENGTRYMMITRYNINGSPAPVDPDSPIPVNFQGQVQMVIVDIVRDASGNVECTVGDVAAGWTQNASIVVGGVQEAATLNGTFQITGVQPTLSPQGIISWKDPAHLSAANGQSGNVTLPAGPVPVAFLPPSFSNSAESVAAFTVVGGSKAGPFFAVSEADVPPFSSSVQSVVGAKVLQFAGITVTRDAGGFVTAPIPDIAGIAVGNSVVVKGVDVSYNGEFALQGVTPGTGAAGTLSWQQGDITAGSTSATLTIQITASGGIQITVDATAGFSAGQNCLLDTGTLGATGQPSSFDGLVRIASILGNVITAASLATGIPTIYPGASLTVLQNLPTTAPAASPTITAISRDAAGNVQAEVSVVVGFAAGQVAVVGSVGDGSFNGNFLLIGVQEHDDGVTGMLSWFQANKPAATSLGGDISGVSDIPINYQDEILANELELSDQLLMSPPPFAADVAYIKSIDSYVYTRGTDSLFVVSDVGDAENVDLGQAQLAVDDNSMSLAIGMREVRTGEIIAIKQNAGYAVTPSDLPPAKWQCPNRWKEHGPPCAAAIGQGQRFLVFPSFRSRGGCYLYIDGQLDWISKEFQQVWDRVTRTALETIWTIVDEDEKEVQIGLPLDGATTPSHIAVASYIEGWGPQEVLNRYGKLITARSAVRWSLRPRAIRSAAVVQRQLQPAQQSLGDLRMFSSISRTAGFVTASYNEIGAVDITSLTRAGGIVVAHVGPVQLPFTAGSLEPVDNVADPSFDGLFKILEIVSITIGRRFIGYSISWAQAGPETTSVGGTIGGTTGNSPPPLPVPGGKVLVTGIGGFEGTFNAIHRTDTTLTWLQTQIGDLLRASNYSWTAGLGGNGVGTLVFPGQPPVGLFVGNSVYIFGTGTALDGFGYVLLSISHGDGTYFSVTFQLTTVMPTDTVSGFGAGVQFYAPSPDQVGAIGNSFAVDQVPDPSSDNRVQTHQVLFGPSTVPPFDSAQIYSADRRSGLRGDGSNGPVLTLLYTGPLEGDIASVIVTGMDDPSFNGSYSDPCVAGWGADGKHAILQFKTTGPTGTAHGGTLYSTLEQDMRVTMQDPDRLDDSGLPLDSRYTPAFASDNLQIIRWGAVALQVGGTGEVTLTPQSDNPDDIFEPDIILLDTSQLTRRVRGLNVPDSEYLTVEISNGNIPGQGFKLQNFKMLGVPVFSGRNE